MRSSWLGVLLALEALLARATDPSSVSRHEVELAMNSSRVRELATNTTSHTRANRDKRRTKMPSHLQPEFGPPIGNVTVVLGRDARLICTVDNLGQYQVAWLKEETKTILSIDTNIIITNYRIFLIPDEEERKWVLHIKDVQESDRGFYQCQVNTNPMRTMSGHLEVVVPPKIVDSQTSQVAELVEHSNVVFQCKADGHPKPSIVWRRNDGNPIQLTGNFNQTPASWPAYATGNNLPTVLGSTTSQMLEVRSDKLVLTDVDRSMGGIYVCIASNGILTQVSKKIPLYVKFTPNTSVQSGRISVGLGDPLEIDCVIEAFPKANSYWSKRSHAGREARRQQTDWSRFPEMATVTPRGATSAPRKQLDHLSRDSSIWSSQSVPAASTNLEHPHNRAHVRYLDVGVATSSAGSSSRIVREPSADLQADGKAYVTVRQTALNAYTYNLKLSIARMQVEDYGEYACIASNSMGTSQSHVLVTQPEKQTGSYQGQGSSVGKNPNESIEDGDSVPKIVAVGDYQRDSLTDARRSAPVPSSNRVVVYDENYLQAIKTRQGGAADISRLHQRLKSKPLSESRSSALGTPASWLFGSSCALSAALLLNGELFLGAPLI